MLRTDSKVIQCKDVSNVILNVIAKHHGQSFKVSIASVLPWSDPADSPFRRFSQVPDELRMPRHLSSSELAKRSDYLGIKVDAETGVMSSSLGM